MRTPWILLAVALGAACSTMSKPTSPREPNISTRPFGTDKNGVPATLFSLRGHTIDVDLTDYGATLVAVRMPDRGDRVTDICLGFDDVSGYQSIANQYFGCTTGRVCNRISNGVFELDGYTYRLATNNGQNHLHGGESRSFDKVHWRHELIRGHDGVGVRFTYRSPDGEEGYPGTVQAAVTYMLKGDDLHIRYEATTDKRTLINLTNHAYWNLAGAGSSTVLDHELTIDADQFTPTNSTLIPTGAIQAVAATALDFRMPTTLGLRIGGVDGEPTHGYDHNFVLRPARPGELRPAAVLRHRDSGRRIEILTTEPGLQLYTGNFLHGQRGKNGATYARRSAVCLETQHFPDSIHHSHFPSTVLAPGEPFLSTTVHRFRVD